MIDDLETHFARQIVDGSDIDKAEEAEARIVAQRRHDLDDVLGAGVKGEFVKRDRMARHRPRQRLRNGLAK